MEKHYERCIKQTPPRQVSILINDSYLREIALHDAMMLQREQLL